MRTRRQWLGTTHTPATRTHLRLGTPPPSPCTHVRARVEVENRSVLAGSWLDSVNAVAGPGRDRGVTRAWHASMSVSHAGTARVGSPSPRSFACDGRSHTHTTICLLYTSHVPD